MKICGIDPGLRVTGYGVIAYDKKEIKLLEAGIVAPESKGPLQNRIGKIYSNLNDIFREYKPDVIVLEKLYSHYRHPTTACILGHVRGVICLLCAQLQIQLAEHSVRRMRKAFVGRGEASKDQTKRMVAHVLGIDKNTLTSDASDALALALSYVQMMGLRL